MSETTSSTRSCSAPAPPGEVCAGRLADGGLSVAIVEQHLVGGECSYYACMPSKALLRPARPARRGAAGAGRRRAVSGELDAAAVLARRDEVIHDLDDSGQLPWLEERGIELFRGAGRLDGERRVAVGDDVLTARQAVVVATGSGAAMPPIDGLDSVDAWNNREATTAKQVPESMIVLGGGPVGCELAQAWSTPRRPRSPWSRAASACSRARSPSPASRSPTRCASSYGVDVRTGAQAERVSRRGRRRHRRARATASGSRRPRSSSRSAASRAPTEIGLDSVGVEPGEHGFLETDDRLRVGGQRVALRDRRRQRPRPVHPHGQVPGLGRGREPARPRGRGDRRRHRLAAGHLHRPPGRRGRQDARAGEGGRASTPARSTSPPTAPPAPASRARKPAAPRGSSSTRTRETIVGATFTGFETADFLHAATIAIVGEVPLDRAPPRRRRLPHPQRDLAEAARGLRAC